MKQEQVAVGSHYITRIGSELVPVEVVCKTHMRVGAYSANKFMTAFVVRRIDERSPLPKPRKAAALRHTKGSWISYNIECGLRALSK